MSEPTLETFEVEPAGEARGTVIWMHGLGATNHDFDDVVPELQAPGLRFVFPAAPIRPVTLNGGMRMPAWYDILTLDDPPLREDATTVREAAASVRQLIEREISRGIAAQRIVLAGFSQGAAMALHVGLRFEQGLAGIMVLSGYLLLPDQFDAERHEANAATNILSCHGQLDPVVPYYLGQQTVERLRAAGYAVEDHSFRMPHSMCMEEVVVIRDWLKARFAD